MKLLPFILAAIVLALPISSASAAPAPVSPAQVNKGMAANSGGLLTKVHGEHRRCRRGRAGWHRHRFTRDDRKIRIECRPWRERRRHRYDRDCFEIGDFVRICPDED